jgi:hypothetical protein
MEKTINVKSKIKIKEVSVIGESDDFREYILKLKETLNYIFVQN